MGSRNRPDATIIGTPRIDLYGGSIAHEASRRVWKIAKTPCTVGRAQCDIQLDDGQVSAAHCELLATEHGVRVRDLGSRNGTFVDGIRVVEAYLDKISTLRAGRTNLVFTPGAPISQELPSKFGGYESRSPRLQAVFGQLQRLASTSVNIHLTGESGVGKGHIALLIHQQSKRAGKPFLKIDLASKAPSLIESAIFGHVRGAFTSAVEAMTSPLIDADGGTVFFDEIGDLPYEQQKRFLRLLDEKVFEPVGGSRERHVDIRIITATLFDLQERVNRKEFRDDLFYRLGPRVELPPLRDRPEDIPLLIEQILDTKGRGDLFKTIPRRTMAWMEHHGWQGNIRGLRDVLLLALDFLGDADGPLDIEGAYAAAHGHDGAKPLAGHASRSESSMDSLLAEGATASAVETAARRLLLRKLHAECDGVVAEIARRADLHRTTVRKELAEMGFVTPEERRKGGGRRRGAGP